MKEAIAKFAVQVKYSAPTGLPLENTDTDGAPNLNTGAAQTRSANDELLALKLYMDSVRAELAARKNEAKSMLALHEGQKIEMEKMENYYGMQKNRGGVILRQVGGSQDCVGKGQVEIRSATRGVQKPINGRDCSEAEA